MTDNDDRVKQALIVEFTVDTDVLFGSLMRSISPRWLAAKGADGAEEWRREIEETFNRNMEAYFKDTAYPHAIDERVNGTQTEA